jgi:hypothetical protein
MNEQVKDIEKKECNRNEHNFKRIQNSALVPLNSSGLGFKTWECQNCDKKVKSS